MARPRLEEANPMLAIRALELALEIGIKPAAQAVGISKNTMRGLLRRNGLNELAKDAALARKLMRVLAVNR